MKTINDKDLVKLTLKGKEYAAKKENEWNQLIEEAYTNKQITAEDKWFYYYGDQESIMGIEHTMRLMVKLGLLKLIRRV